MRLIRGIQNVVKQLPWGEKLIGIATKNISVHDFVENL